MKSWMITFLLLFSPFAFASEELTSIIQCHEALDGKSEGQTQKLTYDSATPIVLAQGKKMYFVTDSSVYLLDNKYQGKSLLIHLKDKDKDFYRQMQIGKDGRIQSMSFDEIAETKEAIEPSVGLSSESLELLKRDLKARVDSMTQEHQNTFDPKDTLSALKICETVSFPEFKKSIEKQRAYFEEALKNPSAYFQGLKKKRRSAEKTLPE